MLSFIATYLLYAHALVSVWCFFAAILSVLIFLHLHARHLGGFPLAEHIAEGSTPSNPIAGAQVRSRVELGASETCG